MALPDGSQPDHKHTANESFGVLAVRLGFVSSEQVAEAKQAQDAYAQAGIRKRIGEVLLEKKYLNSDQLDKIVSSQTVAKKRVGDYELISKLGEGGMGAVFKARQLSMDRIVALKVLSLQNASNPEYRERFQKEAHAIAKLNHPNIVTGIDAGHADGYYYFAMEFVDGMTLGQYLRQRGDKLPESEALAYIRQIALALKHAHDNNLLHRDVKPDNILLDKNYKYAKLADLGLAREATIASSGATKTGQAVGTPFYMSPEQSRGQALGPQTDIYSLGGTLFHMLTGQIPFKGNTAAVIMARHITDPVPNPQAIEPSISNASAKMVMRCLQKNPADRFASVDDLIKLITQIQNGTITDSGAPAKQSKTGGYKTSRASTDEDASTDPSRSAIKRRRFRRRDESTSTIFIVVAVVGVLVLAGLYFAFGTKKSPQKKVPAVK